MPTTDKYHVATFNKAINKPDVMLLYTLSYIAADKKTHRADGNIKWADFESVEDLKEYIFKFQTEFVRKNWTELEVRILNRNEFGHIVPEYIKDTLFCWIQRLPD